MDSVDRKEVVAIRKRFVELVNSADQPADPAGYRAMVGRLLRYIELDDMVRPTDADLAWVLSEWNSNQRTGATSINDDVAAWIEWTLARGPVR